MSNVQSGFTLIELLLYVSIVGAIVFSFSGFLSLLMQSRVKNQTIAAAHYPHATRRVYFPDATHADNAGFSLDA